MTAGRWKQIEELFNQAVEQPEDRREAWLREACRGDAGLHTEVAALLAMDSAGAGVEQSVRQAVSDLEDGRKLENLRIGPYRLLEEIGRGGMGSVYRASRDDDEYQSEVAIKLVRQGMDTEFVFNRFLRERQVLARLRHPNIARLLDGGHTESGVPYIVMEYIRGRMVHEYCQERDLGVPERLRLFLDVCSAVEYSHRSFVVHRDLKPSNILVDETGSPKLLDFGICKLLYDSADLTQGAQMLTPDYASPEQVLGGAVGVGSDVYSLGAVLYIVLTGVKPHQFSALTPAEMERTICEADVRKPSEAVEDRGLARRLAGDLDTIVLKAMEKDPQRRYLSVEQFAEDIRRHLNLLPIVARPDTLIYRASKFTRRHKGPIVAAAAIAATLVGGIVASQREAGRAQSRLQEVRRLSNSMLFDVHDAIRDLPGATAARRVIVDRAVQYLDGIAADVADDPAFGLELAAAYERIGDVQGGVLSANLGRLADALKSYRKAMALVDESIGRAESPAAHAARMRLGRRIADTINYSEGALAGVGAVRGAIERSNEAAARYTQDRGVTHEYAELLLAASRIERTAENYVLAAEHAAAAIERIQPMAAAEPSNVDLQQSMATSYAAAGAAEANLGRIKEAHEHYSRGRSILERLAANDPSSLSTKRNLMLANAHVGDVLGNPRMPNLGDGAGAAKAYGEAMRIARGVRDADPADVRAASDFAIALGRLANVTEGTAARIALLDEAVAVVEKLYQANPKNRNLTVNAAFLYLLAGETRENSRDHAGAERAFRRGYEIIQSAPGRDPGVPRSVAELAAGIGRAAARQGRAAEAVEWAAKVREIGSNPQFAADPQVSRKALRPRAMGLEAGVLAAAGLREDAKKSWVTAAGEWRKLSALPGFTEEHRRSMKSAEEAAR